MPSYLKAALSTLERSGYSLHERYHRKGAGWTYQFSYRGEMRILSTDGVLQFAHAITGA